MRDHERPGARPSAESRSDVAVGFIATGNNDDALLREVIRAKAHGYTPIVTPLRELESDVLGLVDTLGVATVVPWHPEPDVEDLREELRTKVRTGEYSGLILAPPSGERVDYERSRDRLDRGLEVVDAVTVRETGSEDGRTVLVGVPAYNESGTIGGVIEAVREHADAVVVVDDGSEDDTASVARRCGADVIEHDRNEGYGAALKTLFREADWRGVDSLVVIDGDGQHEPSDVPTLLEAQETQGADIVIGNRFIHDARTDLPWHRHAGVVVINTLANVSLGRIRSGSRLTDTQSGFRVYDQSAIRTLARDSSISDGMGASIDVLYHAKQHDYAIEEVGTTIYYDVENRNTHHPVQHGAGIIRNFIRSVETEHPIAALGVPGFLSTLIGLGFSYWTVVNYLDTGTFPYGLAITSVFFTLAGIFSVFTSIILHSLKRHVN